MFFILLYSIFFIGSSVQCFIVSENIKDRYTTFERIFYSLIVGFSWPIISIFAVLNFIKKEKRYQIKNESGDIIIQNVPYKDLHLWLENPCYKYTAELMNEKRSK